MIKSLPIEVEEIMKNRKEGDHLKSMVEVRQENEKLKSTISQIMKNYHSLKLHFHDILQQDQSQKSIDSAASDDESELVSLSLGRFSCDSKRDQKKNSYKTKHQNERKADGLELGLDSKFHSIEVSKNLSPENCSNESKGEENNITHKGSKVARSGDDEILELEQNPLKKPRVSVRLVCNTQTINDGCQWRKYGQKVAKGNPCPRAYYRCTMSSSCPVRKQVQRCAQDMSILTTTYEGTHNHPLPPSAASMASATSAAAAMLNCGSTTSPPLHGGSATPSTFTFNFPSSSTNTLAARTSITTSQSHPTVVLDLTPPNHTSSPCNFSSSSLFSTYNPQLSIYNKLIQASQQGIVSDNIAAATKVITRNPTFQSALAAAITSFVGNGSISNLDQDRKNVKNISFSQSLN